MDGLSRRRDDFRFQFRLVLIDGLHHRFGADLACVISDLEQVLLLPLAIDGLDAGKP